jgi:signal peptidase
MLPWRLHKLRLRAGAALTWMVCGFVFTLLLSAVLPTALGLRAYTVRSGSMTPAIGTGDLVVTIPSSPGEVGAGEIVTFKDPEDADRLITHRVRSVMTEGNQRRFVTRGDANNTSERWSVPLDGSVGRLAYRLPKVGFAVAPLSESAGRLGLVVLPALILLALGLVRIWLPERVGAPATERG